ncbi:KR domain-containing protein [Xylogone sp. PMI_703]|nr:KR domain-containing protein [Xylogone sp. PMI_703]
MIGLSDLTILIQNSDEQAVLAARYNLPISALLLIGDLKRIKDLFATKPPHLAISQKFLAASHEIWRLMPGGSQFILNSDNLSVTPDPALFKRGVSFIASGLEEMYNQEPKSVSNVLNLTLTLLRDHKEDLIQSSVTYDINLLDDSIQLDLAGGNSVAVYDYGRSLVKIRPTIEALTFSPEATYILVGCLGGLGRSLTSFMREHKVEAAAVVRQLEDSGAAVKIYRGDASNEADVSRIIAEVKQTHTIRGVVHAAMVLNDGMFESLTCESFTTAINSKVLGAINLHKALGNTPLDFFANYAAGNSFLDALAWYRNNNGLGATSAALPMVLDVGVVAENENIEASLLRKGMDGIDEREMLKSFQTAMSRPVPSHGGAPSTGDSQLILGIEPAFLAAAISSEGIVDPYWYSDACLSVIRSEVEKPLASSAGGSRSSVDFVGTLNSLQGDQDGILEAIALHIMKKCATILMLPIESFEYDWKSVASYGLDSTIGAELRNWLFKEFHLDIGFQTLLMPTQTFKTLAKKVAETLGLL